MEPLPPTPATVRTRLVLAMALIASGAFILSVRGELYDALRLDMLASVGIGWGLAAVGAAVFLLSYLRGDIRIGALDQFVAKEEPADSADVRFVSATLSRVVMSLTRVQNELAELRNARSTVSGVDPDQIRAAIREDVVADVADKLEARFASSAQEAAHIAQIRQNFDTSSLRLRTELAALTRRGNLNLVIGTLTTVAAVGLLLYMVSPNRDLATWTALLSHYGPRLTTVIFIEVFGFFFLRLYKTSLEEIKYYQNELTNLALNWAAFEAALSGKTSATPLVDHFATVDRNRSVGERGSDIARIETKDVAELLKKVAEVVADSGK